MLRLYADVLRGFRRRAASTVALYVTSGLAESLGIAALLPFLQGALDEPRGVGRSWFGLEGRGLAGAALVVLIVLGLLAAVLRYFAEASVYRLHTQVERSLRTRVTEALFRMRWTAYLRFSLGDSTTSVINEGNEIGRGIQGFVSGIGNLLMAGVFVVVGIIISPTMTAAILVFGLLSMVVYRAVGSRAEATGQSLSSQSVLINEMVTDLFGNAKFYRSTGRRDDALQHADATHARWCESLYRVMRYQPSTRLAFDVMGIAFVTATLALSILVRGASPADALVLVALFYRLGPKLQMAQQSLVTARSQAPWWNSWKTRYEIARIEAETRGGHVKCDHNPVVTVDSVSFVFPNRDTPALNQVSWALPPGDCLAIVGESGSGKTTMLDLVTGLLQPTAGRVLLDGRELESLDIESWQHRIGFVMQDATLFFGSVLDNVAWGDPAPDRAKAMHCAGLAHVADVINALPEGLETQVGHRGGRLSGGQRQRIALARALYRDPWLLLLDEATSALDATSEREIQDALRSLKGSCSILLVAHRLKTVEMADRIVVLSEGRVVEEGTWDELVGRETGAFRKMVLAQEARASSRPGVA